LGNQGFLDGASRLIMGWVGISVTGPWLGLGLAISFGFWLLAFGFWFLVSRFSFLFFPL